MDIVEVELSYTEDSPKVIRPHGISELKIIDRVPDIKVTLRLSDDESTVDGVDFLTKIIGLLGGRCSSAVHPIKPVYYFTFTPAHLASLVIGSPQSAATLVLARAYEAYRYCHK